MRYDLAEFLTLHPPDTDMRVSEWHSSDPRRADCVIETSPWWVTAAERRGANGRLTIALNEVAESEIRLGWRANEVEDLEVLTSHPLLWTYGRHSAIYGNSPMRDPLRFFAQFADLVQQKLRTERDVQSYFAYEAVATWATRVAENRSYHILSAPTPVIEATKPLLDAQDVEYVVVGPSRRDPDPDLKVVVIGESWVICGRADVEVSIMNEDTARSE